MKRFRAALKEKSNWPSLITLALILGCSVFSLWDTKFAEQARSAAFALVAVEFFIMLVVHLDEVKGAVREIGKPKGALQKWEVGQTGTIIPNAKKDVFFCGCALSRLIPERANLLNVSSKIRVRLLAVDVDDKAVCEQYKAIFGRPPERDSLKHLMQFTHKKNIEIRTVKTPLTIHIDASDMNTNTGFLRIIFLDYGPNGYDSPRMELTPADTEWYEFYKNQIELLWAQGTPWKPQGL